MAGVSTKEIKNRIRSMESTRQITKAMEMVAASKLRRAQAQVLSSRPYFEILYSTIADIRDLQLTSFAENGSGRMITNGGKANSYGVELSLRSRITDGLTADLNYGFTRATFRDYIFTDKDENSQIVKTDCKDNFIPYTPRHTVSLGLQYTKLLHRKMVDQFTASAQFTGAGKIFWTEKNDISQPFYGLVNAKVGVRKGIVNLNLWSRNITNTDYQAFYFESFNQSFIQKGKPFQIGGEITVTF